MMCKASINMLVHVMFILVEAETEPDAGTIISKFNLGTMKVRDDDVTDVISAKANVVLFIELEG
jgi:hypothetical protein